MDRLLPRELAWLALAAYAAYLFNATQFLLKLRAARMQHRDADGGPCARPTQAGPRPFGRRADGLIGRGAP